MNRILTVWHEPIGQPRHRVTTRGKFARVYLPKSHPVHGFKAAIQEQFGSRKPIDGPVRLTVSAWFSRPKSEIRKTKPMPQYPHIKKPDADNVVKAVMDALNGLAWHDDAQVSAIHVEKWVCYGTEPPFVKILIEEM